MAAPLTVNPSGWPAQHRRTAGAVDTADVVIGVALLLIVPFVVVALGSVFKGPDPPDPSAASSSPPSDALVPDEELIRMRWEGAERAYERNAKVILRKVEGVDDDRLTSTLRHMATVSLRSALSEVTQLENDMAKYPQQFGPYQPRLATLKRNIEADIDKAR